MPCSRRSFERRAKRIVVSQRFQIGIVSRESAVFRVQCDGAFEVRDGLRVLVALRVRDGEHVDGVVVIRILVADETQVRDRLVVLPAVDGKRRGVQTLVDGLRRGFLLRRLALTDIQVKTNAFVKLAFLRILTQDRLQQAGRLLIRVTLQRFESSLVQRDRLEIGLPSLWRARLRTR